MYPTLLRHISRTPAPSLTSLHEPRQWDHGADAQRLAQEFINLACKTQRSLFALMVLLISLAPDGAVKLSGKGYIAMEFNHNSIFLFTIMFAFYVRWHCRDDVRIVVMVPASET